MTSAERGYARPEALVSTAWLAERLDAPDIRVVDGSFTRRQALATMATDTRFEAEELGFFTLLLTVTGVGPKVALAIVGSRPTADLQLAILQQDHAVLTAIPGIGKKLAERVIFELKEKVTAAGSAAVIAAAGPVGEGDVVAALQALGYSLGEAKAASRDAIVAVGVESTLEERVKAALRSLARATPPRR